MKHILAAVLLLATSGHAQINATWIAKTKMVAYAYFPTTGAKTAEIPINTDLTPGKSISAVASVRSSVSASFANTSGSLRATILEAGAGRYFSSSTRGYSSTGAHQTLLTLKSPKSMKATLRVTWTIRTLGTSGAYAYGSVDIGNDSKFEFSASRTALTKDFPITIDSKGLQVATSTSGRASASSFARSVSYSSGLTLEILPPETCLFYKHGAPCGPVSLSGSNGFGDKVTLTATGGISGGAGMLVMGPHRVDLPLPGTSCRLRVFPVVVIPIRFDSTGKFALTGTVPPLRPFAMPVQIGASGTFLATTNALTIICP